MYALGTPGESCAVHFQTRQSPPSGVFFDFPLRPGRPSAEKLEDRIIRDLDRDPPDLIVLSTARFLPVLEGKETDWAQRLIEWISSRYSRRGSDPTNTLLVFREARQCDRTTSRGAKDAMTKGSHEPTRVFPLFTSPAFLTGSVSIQSII